MADVYDPLVNRVVALAACLLLGCSAADPRADLPFDARPTMRAVLADSRTIAGVLDDGPLADAMPPARRLATLKIARQPAGVDPGFLAAEARLRDAAIELEQTLRAADRKAARRSFDTLLRQCAACHEAFRPGGVAGLPDR